MRERLSEGHVEAPLLLYVGRLGHEKRIHRLLRVLESNPGCRLAVVGTGPAEEDLKVVFKGAPVHFAGQLVGESPRQGLYFVCDVMRCIVLYCVM